jgi:hypothetical protein
MNQLYTKYHVRTPDEQPLDSGCFVLRPFNSDGTIRDPAAVAALKTYANFLPSAQRELRAEITDWVDTPGLSQATRELNVPSGNFADDWKVFCRSLRKEICDRTERLLVEHTHQSVTVEAPPQPCDQIGKWSLSTDEETFHGMFDSEEEAIAEGKATETGSFYVGKCIRPIQPEMLFDDMAVGDFIERVWDHEDYLGDWAEGQVSPNVEQVRELAEQIRPVIAAWLDRQKLRPTFFIIDPKTARRISNLPPDDSGCFHDDRNLD